MRPLFDGSRYSFLDQQEHGLAVMLAKIRLKQCERAFQELTAQADGKTESFWRVRGTRIEPSWKPKQPWDLPPICQNQISRVKKKRIVVRWVWSTNNEEPK